MRVRRKEILSKEKKWKLMFNMCMYTDQQLYKINVYAVQEQNVKQSVRQNDLTHLGLK